MKKNWIAIIVIFVILIAIGAYLKFGSASTSKKGSVISEKPKTTQENTISGTLKSLLSGGKTETCTITYPDNEGSGTIYVDGKKFSGEFTIKGTTGEEIKGHTVSDGTYVYFWSDNNDKGMKMKIDVATSQQTETQQQGNVNLNQKVSYKCTPGVADKSKFTIPSNIQFMDLTNLIKPSGAPAVTGETNQPQVGNSPCDSIANAEAKAACENAIKNAGQ
jgi:hypothetical protein